MEGIGIVLWCSVFCVVPKVQHLFSCFAHDVTLDNYFASCAGMQRRKENSTRYDYRTHKMAWRVEWRFPAADNAAVIDGRISEDVALIDFLKAHITYRCGGLNNPLMPQCFKQSDPGFRVQQSRVKGSGFRVESWHSSF